MFNKNKNKTKNHLSTHSSFPHRWNPNRQLLCRTPIFRNKFNYLHQTCKLTCTCKIVSWFSCKLVTCKTTVSYKDKKHNHNGTYSKVTCLTVNSSKSQFKLNIYKSNEIIELYLDMLLLLS